MIGQSQANTTSYYLADGQHSTRALSDDLGAITDSYVYTAFGDLFTSTGTTPNKYRYTGQQFDELTGLYSLRARYYDPGIGRFLSRDTWPYDYRNPIELNRYVYTANNPITYSDPSGLTFAEYSNISRLSAETIGVLLTIGAFLALYQPILDALEDWGVPTIDIDKPLPKIFPPPFLNPDVISGRSRGSRGPAGGSDPNPFNRPGGGNSPQPRPPDICWNVLLCISWPQPQNEYQRPRQPEPEHEPPTQPEPQPEPQRQPSPDREPDTKPCDPLNDPNCRKQNPYDLAFGIEQYLPYFAASFERETLYFIYWPASIIYKDGQMLLIGVRDILEKNFDYIMTLYFLEVPDGKLQFNLTGMDNTMPGSVTNWELNKIYNDRNYRSRSHFYDNFDIRTGARRELTGKELEQRIRSILQ